MSLLSNKRIVGILLFLLVLLLKLPIINTPHHWDSLGRDIPAAIWILEHNFNPFVGDLNVGHPPFTFELLALSFLIFGKSLSVSHLLVVLFSFLGIYFTYLLALHLFDEHVGIIASLLLFFSPMYFAQSGIPQIEIPFTALTVMTIYFFIKENRIGYLISGSLLVLTKEPAVILIIIIILFKIFKNYRTRDIIYKDASFYVFPLLVFFAWMLLNKIYLGWFLYPGSIGYLGFGKIPIRFEYLIYQVFFQEYRWVLTLLIVTSIIIKNKGWNREEVIFLALVVLIYCIFFAFMEDIRLPRWILVCYPLFFILGSKAIVDIFNKKSYIVMLILVLLFVTKWTGDRTIRSGATLETNLEYLDLIETHREAVKFIETNYPNAVVLTNWPQTMELRYPYEGYTSIKVNAIDIETINESNFNFSNVDIIYYSPQSRRPKVLLNAMKYLNTTLIIRFEKNGKYAEIYRLNKP